MLRLLVVVLFVSFAIANREERAFTKRCAAYRDITSGTNGGRALKQDDEPNLPSCRGPTEKMWFNFHAKLSEIPKE